MIDQHVARGVEVLLGRAVTGTALRMGGFGNENWRVPTGDGDLLVKIGKGIHDQGKIQSSARALQALHTVRFDAFSRVGGGKSFPTWSEYVRYRVPQIVARAQVCSAFADTAFTDTELTTMFDRVIETADAVSPVVRPTLSHRDLYLDNVLVGADGLVRALLDFDIAECWDPTVDLAKPRWQVFPDYEGSQRAFLNGYHEVSAELPRFEERLWVSEMLELTNHAVNAMAEHNHAFAENALARLREIL